MIRRRRPWSVLSLLVFVASACSAGGAETASPAAEASEGGPPAPSVAGDAELPPALADHVRQVASGVVRFDVTRCDEDGGGSGFLVGHDLVATAAHVVDGAMDITIHAGGQTRGGAVIGIDPSADVALVRTDEAVAGSVLTWRDDPSEVAEAVAVLGFPGGGPLVARAGAVSGLDPSLWGGGGVIEDLIQIDVSLDVGNSGGPVVTSDGAVAGLVIAKDDSSVPRGFAVSSSTAAALVERWNAAPEPPPDVVCDRVGAAG